jgi:hypothetical protein
MRRIWCTLFHRKSWGYVPDDPSRDMLVRTGSLMDRHGDRHTAININCLCVECGRGWFQEYKPVAFLRIKLGIDP